MQNASSISGLMLTTEAMICEIPGRKSAPAGGGGEHGPDGMDYLVLRCSRLESKGPSPKGVRAFVILHLVMSPFPTRFRFFNQAPMA